MKTKKLVLNLTLIGLINFSFSINPESNLHEKNGIEILHLNDTNTGTQNQWGLWHQTDCLKGLDFRVKRGNYNEYAKKYKWHVQFRNRYKENIHFNCIAVDQSRRAEIRNSGKTTDRIHVNSNSGTKTAWFLVDATSSIYVHVNKIRIDSNDNWGSNYYDCDK